MVAGDAREDEVVFRWANKLGEDKTIRDVTTVSISSRNTEASATLTQGVTGKYSHSHDLPPSMQANLSLLGVLSALQKLTSLS
jgi:trehalose 6-phosphate synthase/phosphatase